MHCSTLEVIFNDMRSINPRFTYLRTYLQRSLHFKKIVEQSSLWYKVSTPTCRLPRNCRHCHHV